MCASADSLAVATKGITEEARHGGMRLAIAVSFFWLFTGKVWII